MQDNGRAELQVILGRKSAAVENNSKKFEDVHSGDKHVSRRPAAAELMEVVGEVKAVG